MKDPAKRIKEICLSLSRAKTYTPVTAWMATPIPELIEWIEGVNKLYEQEQKELKKNKKRR